MKELSLDHALEEMRRFTHVHLRSCIRQSANISDTIVALEMVNQKIVTLTGDVIGLCRSVTTSCMKCETHVDELITCSRKVSRCLSNASLFVLILLVLLIISHALTEIGNSGKFPSHAFRDT